MRTLLSLIFIICTSQLAQSQVSHDLTLYSEDGLEFKLTMNGKVVNEEYASSVEIKNIEHDYFKAVITFKDDQYEVLSKTIYLATAGEDKNKPQSNVYVLKIKKGDVKLRFQSRSEKKIQDPDINIIINN